MSIIRRDRRGISRLRSAGAGFLLVLAAGIGTTGSASAQYLPEDFFETLPEPGSPAQVEANTLAYDKRADVISAEGRVIMRYSGYEITCDDLRYEQQSGRLICTGNAVVLSPNGTKYTADKIEVTGGMKEAFIQSLTLTTSDGAMVTARDVTYSKTLETVLNEATYSPCGLCVDEKGRKIGWRVRAARLVQDAETKTVYLEQPSLEVLGVPVAWLPWLSLPDPSSSRNPGLQLPSVDYRPEYGARLDLPYLFTVGEDIDILLTPTLMTRQGFLMAAEYTQRFTYGSFTVRGSGIYQLDPGAFDGIGDRRWRGAIQTAGKFEPVKDWTVGWSYSKFSDAAYLDDYRFETADWVVNEVYATHLSTDFYADVRLQEFLRLDQFETDDAAELAQKQQALTAPNARANGYFDLGEMGQVRANGSLLGVYRDEDAIEDYGPGPVTYALGFEGQKNHASGEVSWQKQIVTAGGVLVTPYAGVRADIANYDSGQPILAPGEPDDEFLFQATPIAALDVRWPLMASNGADSHLFEPVAQVVYRGSDTSLVGLTNDNAHSFVLDETNIFSYDRFTGTDREETGLRANIGARYLANFSAGQWLEIIAGQSFHLAGTNAFAEADPTNTGVASGMEEDASYVVLGARGSPYEGLTMGAKFQFDPEGPRVARAGVGGDYAIGDYSVGGDYIYLPAETDTGVVNDQHELTVRASAPLPADYWSANGSLSWDIAAGEWLEARGELVYDDGYFLAGGFAQANGPTHEDGESVQFGLKFALKTPNAEYGIGY